MKLTTCPECKGEKEVIGLFPIWSNDVPCEHRKPVISLPCSYCGRSGQVPLDKLKWRKLGGRLRNFRMRHKVSIREAASLLGIDPIKLFDYESGRENAEELLTLWKEVRDVCFIKNFFKESVLEW